MKNLLDNLRAFNSKERFFLVGEILGTQDFSPTEKFRQRLGDRLGGLSIPADAFSAMDYHIDWIYASLKLASSEETTATKGKYSIDHRMIKAQQEDIDWLIAYFDGSNHHIILIEAKGVTNWSNDQMKSKVARFKAVFEDNSWLGVIPHFILMSPEPPVGLNYEQWPSWMKPDKGKPLWLSLKIPPKWRVYRFNEKKEESKKGEFKFWKPMLRKSGDEE